MDFGTLSGIVTLILIVAFLLGTFWAFGAKQKAAFEDAARIPFDDEEVKS